MESLISVKNLRKQYKEVEALKGISFDVKPGEIFGLVGPNGAGKSTTLKILATILQPTSGEIEYEGEEFTNKVEEFRKEITYLPEEAGAYKNMKGNEYLKFMAEIFTKEKDKQKEYMDRATEICSLGDRLNDKVKTYSKGMTRKLLLARTLMSNPQMTILDEPTSGLDVRNSLYIRDIIKKKAKNGMAVIVSSHNMLEVEYLSDRIAIIDKGEIIETGNPKDIKKKYKAENLEQVFINLTKGRNEGEA